MNALTQLPEINQADFLAGLSSPSFKSGEIRDLPSDAYHSAPGISSSGLRLVGRSLAHYWAKYRDPNRAPEVKSDVFKAGTALHTLILEPDTFADRYAVVPADAPQRPTKAMLEAKNPGPDSLQRQGYWKLFREMNAGKEEIDAEDYDTWSRVRDAVHSHPTVRELIEGGTVAESSIFARVPDGIEGLESAAGTLVKCRPDWRPSKYNVLIDVKSTEDASAGAFARAAMNYGYRESSAFYPDVMEWAGLPRPDSMFFVAFEKEAPFAVSFYEPSERFVEKGRASYRANLAKYAQADKIGPSGFVGYPREIQVLDVMGWEK